MRNCIIKAGPELFCGRTIGRVVCRMWKINALQLMAERCQEDSLMVTWLPDGILFEMSKHKVSQSHTVLM